MKLFNLDKYVFILLKQHSAQLKQIIVINSPIWGSNPKHLLNWRQSSSSLNTEAFLSSSIYLAGIHAKVKSAAQLQAMGRFTV